jgi:hypothetical protein
MPGPAAGIAVRLTAHSGLLQLFGAALGLPYGYARVGTHGESYFSAALGELGICAIAARFGDGTFAFCAGAQAGAIWGRAEGLWMAKPSQQALLQAAPSVSALIPVSPWLLLQTGVGATFPVIFPSYSFVDEASQRRTYHTVEMGLWGELGVALRFGS